MSDRLITNANPRSKSDPNISKPISASKQTETKVSTPNGGKKKKPIDSKQVKPMIDLTVKHTDWCDTNDAIKYVNMCFDNQAKSFSDKFGLNRTDVYYFFDCDQCIFSCKTLNELERHLKLECKPNQYYRNIYNLNPNTFGKNIFTDETAGTIYLIQNTFEDTLIKIGKTVDLNSRLSDFRTGNGYEPRLYCYFSVRNMHVVEDLIKNRLSEFNINGEIFKEDPHILRIMVRDIINEKCGNDFHEYEPTIHYRDVHRCWDCDIIFKTNLAYLKHMMICNKVRYQINSSYIPPCLFCNGKHNTENEYMDHKCIFLVEFVNRQKKEEQLMYKRSLLKMKTMFVTKMSHISSLDKSFLKRYNSRRSVYLNVLHEMKRSLKSEFLKDSIFRIEGSFLYSTKEIGNTRKILEAFENMLQTSGYDGVNDAANTNLEMLLCNELFEDIKLEIEEDIFDLATESHDPKYREITDSYDKICEEMEQLKQKISDLDKSKQ